MSGRTTLSRSLVGGGFNLFQGTIDEAEGGVPIQTLPAAHLPARESLSSFLLGELGVANKRIAKNLQGETNPSPRHFAA